MNGQLSTRLKDNSNGLNAVFISCPHLDSKTNQLKETSW